MNNKSQQNPIFLDYEEALINDSHIHLSLFGTGSGKSYVCLKKIANIIDTIASKKIYPEKDRFVFATPTKQNIQDSLEKMQKFLSKDLFDKYVVHIKSNEDIFKEYLSDNVTRKHIKDLHEEKEIKINNYIQEYNFYNPRKKLSKDKRKIIEDYYKNKILKTAEDKALEEAKFEANIEISKNKITNSSEQKEIHQKHKNLITELYKKEAIKKIKPVNYLLVDTYYNGSFKDIKETYTIEYSEDKKTKKQKKAYRVFQCSGFLNKSTKEINETLNQHLSNNYAD